MKCHTVAIEPRHDTTIHVHLSLSGKRGIGYRTTASKFTLVICFRIHARARACGRIQVHMYAMVQTQSGTPYAGIKGMLRTIFALDHLGDDAFAVKQALLKVGI